MSGYTTFDSMIDEVGRIVGDTSTGRRVPIKDALRRHYDTIAAAVEWPQLVAFDDSGLRTLGATTVASLEAGEPEAPAPFDAGKIRSIMIQGQDAPAIEVVQPGFLVEVAGSQLSTASRRPVYAAQIGVTAQTLRLEADDALTAWAPDTSQNDNTQTVRVEYRTSDAPLGHESFALIQGIFSTGAAMSGTVAAGYSISKVTLAVGWAGAFELRDGDGNVIVHIASDMQPATNTLLSQRKTRSRPLYRFWPTPDTDYGLTWTWWRHPRRLQNELDAPEMPVSAYLIEAAASDILQHMDKAQAAMIHQGQADKFVRMLMRQNNRGAVQVLPRGGNFGANCG